MGTLRDDLAAVAIELRETHISWVFLHEARVFKVKKPVDFGFLDFSTREARQRACSAEVQLNRRLAPEVYRGVRDVVRDERGNHRIVGMFESKRPDEELVDHAVEMERLPDEERADVLLERGVLDFGAIDRVALTLARFHQRCPTDQHIREFGRVRQIRENVEENFAQTRDTVFEHLTADEVEQILEAQRDFLAEEEELLDERAARGRVREGHGDLRLEHVYLGRDEIRVLDCIEFNERFRHADVAADLAFLSMDLAWHGRVDLAERLLATYARESNDFELYRVIDFYEAYRAYVRGKIASLVAADPHASALARERAHQQARRYYLLALAAQRPPLAAPIVISVGGLIASGKSTVADDLGRALGAPVVSSDRTRKHLYGVDALQSLGEVPGAYSTDANERVQGAMVAAAEAVLESGRPVILDATHRSASARHAARALAARQDVPFLFLECQVPLEVLRARLERRRAEGRSESDAGPELLERFVSLWEPPSELPAGERLVLDTSRPLAAHREILRAAIPGHPAGLLG